jgi:electron transfer flavoprotein alpha subunit
MTPSFDSWILVAEETPVGGLLNAARGAGGQVTALVVGPRALAESVAAAGPELVVWLEPGQALPAEAYAEQVAQTVAAAKPRVVLSSTGPAGRVLLTAAASKLGAVVLSAVHSLSDSDDSVLVVRGAVADRVLETVRIPGAVAGVFAGEDVPRDPGAPARIDAIVPGTSPSPMRIVSSAPAAGQSSGLLTAARVVAVGCGLRARDDMTLIDALAASMGAEVACTMPVASDLGWVPEDRYVGRSGQHIAPELYLAVGISGAPQHLEGVQRAKVVVAINNDPSAPIFKRCQYGIVGDLYEVVPALTAVLKSDFQQGRSDERSHPQRVG